MNEKSAEQLLLQREVKPTAVRVLVLRELQHAGVACSLTDLEARLQTVDKSSIFRTLTHFLSHHLVHIVDDGSGQKKYALCMEGGQSGAPVRAHRGPRHVP